MEFSWKTAVFFAVALFSSLAAAVNEELVITNADRAIDLSSQLVKIAHRLTLSNNGKATINSFTFLVAPDAKDDLSFFEAQVDILTLNLKLTEFYPHIVYHQVPDSKKVLASTPNIDADGNLAYSIALDKALEAGQTRKVAAT